MHSQACVESQSHPEIDVGSGNTSLQGEPIVMADKVHNPCSWSCLGLLQSLGKKWKDYKCELRSQLIELYQGMDELMHNRSARIPRDQWVILVNYWNSDRAKMRSAANRRSRKKQKLVHNGGSKSVARVIAEKTIDGVESFRAHMFLETHHNCKDGRPMNEEIAHIVALMKEKLANPSNSLNEYDGEVTWEGDIYSQVLGPEKYGQLRGLGLGPTPKSMWGLSSSQLGTTTEIDKVTQMEVELKAMKEEHQQLLAEIQMIRSILCASFARESLSFQHNR